MTFPRTLLRTVWSIGGVLSLAILCAASAPAAPGAAETLRPDRMAAESGAAAVQQASAGGHRDQRRPLDVVADLSNQGYRIALPVAWCVLALDVLLVLFALAVPRHRGVVGRVVQHSAWLFGPTAWMMGTVICLFLGGWRWFVGGVLLAGVGVIPVGIYVGVLSRPGGGLVESLIAMTLATVGAWYAGRRLRRMATPPPNLAQQAGADAR